jgi:hypothetical protein
MNNVYSDPKYADIVSELKQELQRLQTYYKDDPSDIGDNPRTGLPEYKDD